MCKMKMSTKSFVNSKQIKLICVTTLMLGASVAHAEPAFIITEGSCGMADGNFDFFFSTDVKQVATNSTNGNINLNILSNQDFVWGVALMISGAMVAYIVIKDGVEKMQADSLTGQPGDFLGKDVRGQRAAGDNNQTVCRDVRDLLTMQSYEWVLFNMLGHLFGETVSINGQSPPCRDSMSICA